MLRHLIVLLTRHRQTLSRASGKQVFCAWARSLSPSPVKRLPEFYALLRWPVEWLGLLELNGRVERRNIGQGAFGAKLFRCGRNAGLVTLRGFALWISATRASGESGQQNPAHSFGHVAVLRNQSHQLSEVAAAFQSRSIANVPPKAQPANAGGSA